MKVLTHARMETHPWEFEEEDLTDALGQDLLQAYLAAAYSVYRVHRQLGPVFPSPLLYGPDGQKRKALTGSFEDL